MNNTFGASLSRIALRIYFWCLAAGTVLIFYRVISAKAWPFTREGDLRILDFSSVWAAARRVLDGNAALAYNHFEHPAFQAVLIGVPPEFSLTFTYPPSFLALIWPLGLMPYPVAIVTFVLAGMACWYLVLRMIVPDRMTAAAMTIAAGGATHSIMLGQNGFLSASLITAGLLLLPRRPALAGIAFGLLTFKPHLGLALVLLLLMRRDWMAIAWAVGTTLVLAAIATIAFGPDIWPVYLASSRELSEILQHRADLVVRNMMQSPLAILVRHFPWNVALAAQAGISVITLALLAFIVSRRPGHAIVAAATIAATLLSSPYLFLYDTPMLTGAAAFLLTQRLRALEIGVLLLALALPALWFFSFVPFVPLSAWVIISVCLLHSMRGTGQALSPENPLQERPAAA